MSTCIACQKEGKNVCSRCKACYCSVNCQKKHWPVHQKVCVKPDFAKPDKKPMANGVVSHTPGKINHDMGEEELLVEMDDLNINGDVTFNIDEIRPQAELKRQSKVVIYAVENMLMKGQAVDVNETKKFLSLMQDLSQCVKENKRPLDAGSCKEGVLVLFDYQGEFTRGAVTKFDSRKLEATVLAIDFGNKEIVKLSDLYVMPQSALDVPRQCRTLVLHGFPSNLDPLTKDALSGRLKNITQDRILQFSVKGKVNGIYSGVLTVEDSNENVNDMMMSYYEEIKMSNKETTMRKRVMLQDIPMQPYPKGPEFNVIVTDVRSPSCFFAQIITEDKSNIAALEDLFSKLQELPDNSVSMEFSPVQNEACLAFFTEDQTWSRASVERIYPDGTVRVVFIDYGNVEDLDSCYVRPMTHEFSQLPRQAREFCLFGVKSSSSTGEWSDEAKKLFKDMVLSDSICNASCMSINDDTCVAELYLPNLKCYPHKILLEKGVAVAVTSCETLKENDAKFPFTLESNSIERTGQHRVIPLHFVSPHEFYVQIADREQIQQVYEFDALLQDLPVAPYSNPIVGDSCCALFSDDVWYRAKVVSIDGSECCVYFYDYGNTATVPLKNLRVMPEEMKSLKGQAIKVKLCDVLPTGESWRDEAKELMESKLSFQPCILNVLKIENELLIGSLTVETNDCDVAKMLVDAKLAKPLSKLKEDQSSVVVKSKMKEKSSEYNKETGSVSKSQTKRKPFTLSIEQLFSHSNQRVIPVHFVSPDEFYVQIADREKIQQVYEFDALLHNLPVAPYSNPIVGDSCCALFSDDVWYRAKVVSIDGSECYVYFYDYGNTATVPIKNLRVMPEEMKSLKGQAIRVKLCDVLPTGESWIDEAKELMESKLSFQPCILNVLKIENELLIGSLTVETNDCDVAKMLVDAKLAKPLSKLKEDQSSVVVKSKMKEKSSEYNKETGSVSKSQTKRKPFTLSIEQLFSHSNQQVIPVHFVSPDEFYVQIADREKIQQVYEFDALLQDLPVAPYSNPIVGDSCCALFSDDVWYRAKVVSIDGSECCVYFYDYGNTATVPIKNLRVMPEEMKSLKGQAIRVKLCDVLPIGESWRDEAKELMESKLSFQPCILNVLKIKNELLIGSLTVETNDCDVAKMLVDAKLAKPLSKLKEDQSSVVVKNQIEEKSLAYNKETGSVSKSQTKRKPFTLNMEQLVSHTNQQVIPVHFVSPDEFYVQIADREKIQQVYEFDALLQDLPVAPYSNPIVGDSCCALFSDDVWYRAKVVSIDGSECYVYFYDYGNTATVPIKNLRVMPEEMKSLKGQAIKVKLYDVLPTGESWKDEAKELMESKLSFQPCILNVLKIESGVVVGSLLREEDGLDICIELISAHLARSKFADSSNITKEVLGSGMVQVGALVPDVVGTNSLELEEEVPIKQTNVEDGFGSRTKTEENRTEFEEERPRINAEPRPKTGKFKGKGAFGKANKPNDSERSSGDDGSDEYNFYSRRSKKFVYQQNLKGRDHVFGRGVRGKFSKSHNPGHGHGSRSNHMLPPFPFFHPMMLSSLLMAPNSPSPMSPNSESESESLNFSESPKIDNKGQDWSFAEGKVNQFLQGDPHTAGRGQMLNQWVDAWQRMSDFMNSAMATRSYKGFSDSDATHSYGNGNSFSKGRGGPRNMSRGTGRGAGRGQRPRLPQGQIPPSMLIGNKVDCVVTWVEHPSHFYIKPISDTGSAVLADDIYENAELAREANVGALVAAKSPSSGHFFRGIIEQCYASDSALIRDIDSGPTEVINTAGLRKMRVQDAEKPLQVIRCTLDNVVPKFSNLWSTAAIKYMKHKLSTANGKVKIIVRGQNSFAVRVNVCDPNNEERHIGKDLVKIGFAKFIY